MPGHEIGVPVGQRNLEQLVTRSEASAHLSHLAGGHNTKAEGGPQIRADWKIHGRGGRK